LAVSSGLTASGLELYKKSRTGTSDETQLDKSQTSIYIYSS